MIEVQVKTVHTNTHEERRVIGLSVQGNENRKEIIRFYAKNEMYGAGLEKDFKKLVDLYTLAESIRDVIQAYVDLNKLTESKWLEITNAYEAFIDKKLKWEHVKEFIANPKNDGEWE